MMLRKGFTRVELLIVVVIFGIAAAVVYPVFTHPNRTSPRSQCQSNLKQIGLGFMQYVQDYHEKMPILSTNAGWKGAVMPYLKADPLFQCAAETTGLDNPTDYWFNRRLNAQSLDEVNQAAITILAGEGNDGADAVSPDYNYGDLPANWRVDDTSPAQRHTGIGNYLYVDGHVKALKAAQVGSRVDDTTSAQFALK